MNIHQWIYIHEYSILAIKINSPTQKPYRIKGGVTGGHPFNWDCALDLLTRFWTVSSDPTTHWIRATTQ